MFTCSWCSCLTVSGVRVYPWLVFVFIRGWCSCLPVAGVRVYPWLVFVFIRGWCSCLPVAGVRVYPWLVFVFTRGWCSCLPVAGVRVYQWLVFDPNLTFGNKSHQHHQQETRPVCHRHNACAQCFDDVLDSAFQCLWITKKINEHLNVH